MNPRITEWRGRRVWLIGASSGIGAALAHALLERGARVALSARRATALAEVAQAHPLETTLLLPLDVARPDQFCRSLASIIEAWDGIDLVLFCAGNYRAMGSVNFDAVAARDLVDTNLSGVLNGLGHVLPQLLKQGSGALAIVASVAGYRGLPLALAYGPTKAALINLAEGLYFDLRPKGIGVHLVNPGFVRTPLTADNAFRMPALIEPAQAACEILRGLERGQFEIHFPRRFTRVLKALRLLPYRAYFPLLHKLTGL